MGAQERLGEGGRHNNVVDASADPHPALSQRTPTGGRSGNTPGEGSESAPSTFGGGHGDGLCSLEYFSCVKNKMNLSR